MTGRGVGLLNADGRGPLGVERVGAEAQAVVARAERGDAAVGSGGVGGRVVGLGEEVGQGRDGHEAGGGDGGGGVAAPGSGGVGDGPVCFCVGVGVYGKYVVVMYVCVYTDPCQVNEKKTNARTSKDRPSSTPGSA